ncbi:zinc transporter ZupT [Mycoplasmopsis mustelae]|uniref:Zinc transporter ZupT n=1 Tax=Mycoplasmopsis mustelae TaxID=171289 RepID=A0A4R7UDA7_9BACT|nr:ZIP family metal transporter [Mycoplasmopsis mustelae]TDV24447.1 zinc transporter ZupT [Mycoplasmopsis mustelae]
MKWITNLYNAIENGINAPWASKLILSFLFLFALLLIPTLLSLLLPFFRKSIHKNKVYLYAFSTGFFIVLSTYGFLKESLEVSSGIVENLEETHNSAFLLNVGLVGGGILSGLIFAFVLKFVISHRLNKKLMVSNKLSVFSHQHSHNNHHHNHQHDSFLNNQEDKIELAEDTLKQKVEGKLKLIALLLLLTHRIPEGLLIGYSLNQLIPGQNGNPGDSALTTAYFASLILHLIPEEMIFYVRLRDAGFSPWKALFISFLGLSLFLPFILIGIYGGDFVNEYLKSIIYSAIGGIFLFTSLVEFFPEFYHEFFNKKKWLITIIFLFLGVVFSVIILSFHSH